MSTPCLHGQARRTATRATDYDVFGGFSYVNSGYRTPRRAFGGTLGADFTKFIPQFRGLITPSLEVRGTLVSGPFVGERTFEAGLRLASTYKRFHPYGDLLVGVGVITFAHPALKIDGQLYRRDSGFAYVYGGGLIYDTRSNFSYLADYQRQYWNLGQQPPERIYPGVLTFGVVYHIPFKAYKTR